MTRDTHTTIVKLATELMIDGLSISEALTALANIKKYGEHMEWNLFSEPSTKIASELLRRNIVAAE